MNRKIITYFLLVAVCSSLWATGNATRYGIIPKPVMLKEAAGEFKFSNNTTIVYPESNVRLGEIAEDFATRLQKTSGLAVKAAKEPHTSGQIFFRIAERDFVKENMVFRQGANPAAFFIDIYDCIAA